MWTVLCSEPWSPPGALGDASSSTAWSCSEGNSATPWRQHSSHPCSWVWVFLAACTAWCGWSAPSWASCCSPSSARPATTAARRGAGGGLTSWPWASSCCWESPCSGTVMLWSQVRETEREGGGVFSFRGIKGSEWSVLLEVYCSSSLSKSDITLIAFWCLGICRRIIMTIQDKHLRSSCFCQVLSTNRLCCPSKNNFYLPFCNRIMLTLMQRS